MNNRSIDRVTQKDREFEELLCLAYLFTHASSFVEVGEAGNPPADNVELHSASFIN